MSSSLRCSFAFFLLFATFQVTSDEVLHAAADQTLLENIALGKPYTLSRPPGYRLCTDAGDRTQLTDGQFTKGYFWTQESTVGWQGGQPVLISIDLGQVEPIRGVAFSTAAGKAGVQWPEVLMLMVSDDGEQWYPAGDIVPLSAKHGTRPELGYGTHTYRTEELKTYGRYVQIGVVPTENFVFVDEIEVYGGDQTFLGSGRGKASDDPSAILNASRVTQFLASQLRADLDKVRASIASEATPKLAKATLLAEAEELQRRVTRMPAEVRQDFKAVLPMNDLEREIFSLQASLWREQGKETVRVWKTHRWDMLGPSEEPPAAGASAKLHVDLLNGEHRADVLNITVADSEEVRVRVRVEGLPGGTNPEYFAPHEVLCVGTRHLGAISSPLPLMQKEGDSFVMTIAPGMTRQIWFDFHPTDLPPGKHQGQITLQYSNGSEQSVPLELVVWPWDFPKQTSLLLGGWSYTNAKRARGMTEKNRDALIDFLQDYHVNSPWATRAALPEGKYDEQGKLTQSPNTANFDAWVQDWPEAKRYMVFLAAGGYTTVTRPAFAGSKPGTDLFEKKLASWAHFWANHMRKLGLQPSQLGLCVFDEPHSKEQFDLISLWYKAIKQAEPDIVAMVDPVFRTEDHTYLPMMEVMDELVPNRRLWNEHADWYPEIFAKQHKEGRKLGFYTCGGPARSFDPYAHYLLQAWHTFQVGGTWSGYWSFSDTRGADPWNEFSSSSTGSFCPMYLLETKIMTDKRMEAIRESAQDYEYLVMLRERIERIEVSGEKKLLASQGTQSFESCMRRGTDRIREKRISLG